MSDYLEVIRQPMDLSTVMTKIDTLKYLTVKEFLVDIDLICSNALEYNPDKDPGGEAHEYTYTYINAEEYWCVHSSYACTPSHIFLFVQKSAKSKKKNKKQ